MKQPLAYNLRFARKAFLIFALNSAASSLGVAAATICDAVIVGNAFGVLQFEFLLPVLNFILENV